MLIGFSAITKELVLACRQLDLKVDDTLAAMLQSVSELESSAPSSQIDIFMDKNAGPVPKRMPDSEVQMKKHSKVLGGGKRPKCLKGNGQ